MIGLSISVLYTNAQFLTYKLENRIAVQEAASLAVPTLGNMIWRHVVNLKLNTFSNIRKDFIKIGSKNLLKGIWRV